MTDTMNAIKEAARSLWYWITDDDCQFRRYDVAQFAEYVVEAVAPHVAKLETAHAEALKHADDNARAATHEGARAEQLRVAVLGHIKATGYCDQHDEDDDEIEGPEAGLCSDPECTYCALVRADNALAEHARQPVPAIKGALDFERTPEEQTAFDAERAKASAEIAAAAVPACGCDALVAALEAIATDMDASRDHYAQRVMRTAQQALAAHRARPVAQAGEGGDNG